MAVVLVVDDAHVRQVDGLTDSDHVLRLATPTAMVVDREPAASIRQGLSKRTELVSCVPYLRRLIEVRRSLRRHPKRRLQAPSLQAFEQARQIRRGRPERIEGNASLCQCIPLCVKCGNMFPPPVIGKVLQAQLLKHRRSFFRPPLLRIEWHDAPGNKIVTVKEFPSPRGTVNLLRG